MCCPTALTRTSDRQGRSGAQTRSAARCRDARASARGARPVGHPVIIRSSPLAIPAIVAATLAVCACTEPRQGFDSVFEEVARIQLEESADDPIVSIRHVARRPNGGFVLADQGAARVRLFDSTGRQDEVLGRYGEGPGEFRTPTAAIELADGRVVVTDGSSPTLTVFAPTRTVQLGRVQGQYGFWIERLGDNVVAGLGSRGNRFAILDRLWDAIASFGPVQPEVNEVPFWIFFANDRATVAKDRVIINTTFYPTLRIFDSTGDSVGTIGTPPPMWIPPNAPPVDRLADPGDRERIEEWSRGFTVVRDLATVADTLVVVQYGSHDPQRDDPYHVEPAAIDVYALNGRKLAEGLALIQPIVGGGTELLVLSAQPPDPWTIAVYKWRGQQ